MDNRKSGESGEVIARQYYKSRGYEVLECNFRHKRAEIDFIALTATEQLLVFVEVKKRSRKDYGEAESFVSESQQRRIEEAAEAYIFGINWHKDIRFDIACVDALGNVEVFEDAF
ncbi:MAG: YraN family protein [Bacteroidota bacterium]